MGFKAPSEAIGKQIKRSDELYPIVGVVKDFNQRSLKDPIEPLALVGNWSDRSFRVMHFTMTSSGQNSVATTISKIESVFKSIYPEADFKVNFMDETVEKFYIQEKSLSKLLNWAMGLSILISCLGLLGLVIYTTNRRVKEIGVRKVLGASLLQINTLLCKEFLILVAIAFIIASPIAWYGIHNWLQDFAYKTSISFWVFLASGSAMVFFALLVISIKTLQAANANPVNSLRSE
jgi:putative ABC transport system permease protein